MYLSNKVVLIFGSFVFSCLECDLDTMISALMAAVQKTDVVAAIAMSTKRVNSTEFYEKLWQADKSHNEVIVLCCKDSTRK